VQRELPIRIVTNRIALQPGDVLSKSNMAVSNKSNSCKILFIAFYIKKYLVKNLISYEITKQTILYLVNSI
jgi:hypothetical protein